MYEELLSSGVDPEDEDHDLFFASYTAEILQYFSGHIDGENVTIHKSIEISNFHLEVFHVSKLFGFKRTEFQHPQQDDLTEFYENVNEDIVLCINEENVPIASIHFLTTMFRRCISQIKIGLHRGNLPHIKTPVYLGRIGGKLKKALEPKEIPDDLMGWQPKSPPSFFTNPVALSYNTHISRHVCESLASGPPPFFELTPPLLAGGVKEVKLIIRRTKSHSDPLYRYCGFIHRTCGNNVFLRMGQGGLEMQFKHAIYFHYWAPLNEVLYICNVFHNLFEADSQLSTLFGPQLEIYILYGRLYDMDEMTVYVGPASIYKLDDVYNISKTLTFNDIQSLAIEVADGTTIRKKYPPINSSPFSAAGEFVREVDNSEEYRPSYNKYGGAGGYPDDAIDTAFEGDPENIWNVD